MKNTRGTRSDVFPSSTPQQGRKKIKIKIKRRERREIRVFFEYLSSDSRWCRNLERENGQINPQYIYIWSRWGTRFMRLSRRCLYGMTRYVGEKRSSGHKSLYRNFEFSVSMSMIDLGRSKQAWDRSAGDVWRLLIHQRSVVPCRWTFPFDRLNKIPLVFQPLRSLFCSPSPPLGRY